MEVAEGEPTVPKAGVESGVERVQLDQGDSRTIIVTRELFPKHPPSGARFSSQEDYEAYLEKYTGRELTITKEDEWGAKEAGYSCYLDCYSEMVVDD